MIVERHDGFTRFSEDINPNHVYRDAFYRNSSVWQTASLNLPIFFRFNSKSNENLSFSVGMVTEYLLAGQFQRKFKDPQEIRVIDKMKKDNDFHGLRRFQIGPSFGIRYKSFILFGEYMLTPAFKTDQGLKLNRFDFGIMYIKYWK